VELAEGAPNWTSPGRAPVWGDHCLAGTHAVKSFEAGDHGWLLRSIPVATDDSVPNLAIRAWLGPVKLG
jgi:hypothetical protein